MWVNIDVTNKNINCGNRESDNCPIALSINKILFNSWANVSKFGIRISPRILGKKKYHSISLKTPRKAQRFINRFDDKKDVSTFCFNLNIPKEFLKPSVIEMYKKEKI